MSLDFNHKSVAVIGNARSLFERSYGQDIDNYDTVIRINRAAQLIDVSPDYEKSHGTRTDVWCMWRHNEYQDLDFQEPDTVCQMTWWEDPPPEYVHQIDTRWFSKMVEPWTASTGLMILAWLSKFNCNVNVYGFDWKATPTYTDLERNHEQTHIHNFEHEKRVCEDYFVAFKEYKFWT